MLLLYSHAYDASTGKARGFFKSGDMVIVVTGWIPGSGHTNIMRAVSAE